MNSERGDLRRHKREEEFECDLETTVQGDSIQKIKVRKWVHRPTGSVYDRVVPYVKRAIRVVPGPSTQF